jgi:radical SAM superfamily enzyme
VSPKAAAQALLMVGKELVPLRPDYSSADMVEQILYMVTLFDENSVLGVSVDTIPQSLRDAMIEMLEEAKQYAEGA